MIHLTAPYSIPIAKSNKSYNTDKKNYAWLLFPWQDMKTIYINRTSSFKRFLKISHIAFK